MEYKRDLKDCWYVDDCDLEKNCSIACTKYHIMRKSCSESGLKEKDWHAKKLNTNGVDKLLYDKLEQIRLNMTDLVHKEKNIYIYSKECGNGKTSWAIRLLLNYFNQNNSSVPKDDIYRGMFVSVPEFLLDCKDNIVEKSAEFQTFKRNIRTAKLVVFDDIGYTKLTEYDNSTLLPLIDTRIRNRLSCIFTSNCDREMLQKNMGERLTSRIFDSSICIEFLEESKRG